MNIYINIFDYFFGNDNLYINDILYIMFTMILNTIKIITKTHE